MKSYKYYDLILGAYVCVLLFTPFSLNIGDTRLAQALARGAK